MNDLVEKEKYPEGKRDSVAIATRRIVNFFKGEIVDIKSIKLPDKIDQADKTDLPVTSESSDLSIDVESQKSKNSHVGIDEPEENEGDNFNDDIIF